MKLDPQDPIPFTSRSGPLEGSEPGKPSLDGEFPVSLLESFSATPKRVNEPFAIRPLVIDTNVLRNDLLRAAQRMR